MSYYPDGVMPARRATQSIQCRECGCVYEARGYHELGYFFSDDECPGCEEDAWERERGGARTEAVEELAEAVA